MKKLRVSILLLGGVFLFAACTQIDPFANEGGYIDGIFLSLEEGGYGIEGKAYPAFKLLSIGRKVRYRVDTLTSDAYIKWGYKNGDKIDFLFDYVKIVNDKDWTTLITLMSP